MGIPAERNVDLGAVVREFLTEPDSGKIERTFVVDPTSTVATGFTADGLREISGDALRALVESTRDQADAAAEPVV